MDDEDTGMKSVLKQLVLRLPFIGRVAAVREALSTRLRGFADQVDGRSIRARFDVLRRDIGQLLRLSPLFVARDRQGFLAASGRAHLDAASRRYTQMLQADEDGSFYLRRFCLCCNETTPMLADYQSSWLREDGSRQPNWRERLICRRCGMNNRQRLMAKLVQQSAMHFAHPRIYFMEQVTPIFRWMRNLPGAEVHGSEYLGYQYQGGDRIKGVRHEDVMNLSYPDESFDLIVSNDVLEHIPDPERAFRECFRVLRPGGAVLATFPFQAGEDKTVARARLEGGKIQHLLPPQYHGNPMSSDGSLVFHDFGWDLLDVMRSAGFSSAVCESYASDEFGHLGTVVLVFRLTRPGSPPAA